MTDLPSARVAFIGLGQMGAPMARRLVDAGVDIIGCDPQESARRTLAVAGAATTADPAHAAHDADTVILMLPDSSVVESVLGAPTMLEALHPGRTVIDMSSSDPVSTQRLADELSRRGITLIDAPVSGGVGGAEAGTLTIMAGGPADAVNRAGALLAPLGKLRHVGDSGAGHAVKALNNLLAGINLLAAAEAVDVGSRFGLDPEVLVAVINSASGRSVATEAKFPRDILPGTYDSGFAMRLMLKDMRIATGLAASLDAPAELGEQAVALWDRAHNELGPQSDQTAIAQWRFIRPPRHTG